MKTALLVLLLAQDRITTNAGCVECHAEQQEMWMESVHQKESISCIECHGADSIDPKKDRNKHLKTAGFQTGLDKDKVTAFCAQCHEAEAKSFMKSVHYEKSQERRQRKLQGCRNCHASHETQTADAQAIQDDRRAGCVRCHKKDTNEYALGAAYIALVKELDGATRTLEERILAPQPGISQAREAVTVEAGKFAAKDVRIRQHACDYEGLRKRIEASVIEARAGSGKLEYREEEFEKRYYWLAGALAVIGLNVLLVWARGRKWRRAPTRT